MSSKIIIQFTILYSSPFLNIFPIVHFSDPMQLLIMSFAVESFWGAPIQNISAKLFSIKDEFEGPELILPGGYKDILDQ